MMGWRMGLGGVWGKMIEIINCGGDVRGWEELWFLVEEFF